MPTSTNDRLCSHFIHNLFVLRRQFDLPKKAMAKLLGISLYSLNLLESGVIPKRLGVEVVFRVQSCFGVSIRDLFEQTL